MTAATLCEVLDGGLLTTVQDAGRADWTHVGVPESGAADQQSLAVANLLVGNEPGAAALEMTLVGPTIRVERPFTLGLAGADLGGRIRGGRRLPPGRSHRLAIGDIVEFPGSSASTARAYLAVPGGIDVPLVLGSRSTCLAGGFGGLDGRPLRPADLVVGAAHRDALVRPELAWSDLQADAGAPTILRILGSGAAGLDSLVAGRWRVSAAADRVGIRLDGDPLPAEIGGEAVTHGVPWGAIQVPPDGRPIILGADHQTTGGYRVIGIVISADRPVLGQLRPGASIGFVTTDQDTAVAALRARRDALVAGAAALHDALSWDALIDTAGG